MKHVVAINKGTHWHVIADYSQSKTISKLTSAQWKQVYAGDGFKEMRKSQPGSVAKIISKGAGLWTKNWARPYVPPPPTKSVAELRREELKGKMSRREATMDEIQEYLSQ